MVVKTSGDNLLKLSEWAIVEVCSIQRIPPRVVQAL